MRDRCYETTGFVLIQRLPLEEFSNTYEEREEVAKLFYYMMSVEIGLVSDRRDRLYDVRDRGLNAGQLRRHMVRTWIDFNPQWSKEK